MPRGHVTGLLHYFLCCCVTLAFSFSNRVVSVEGVVGRVEGAVCHCGGARTLQTCVDEHSRHELCVCVLMDFPTTVLQKLKFCTNQVHFHSDVSVFLYLHLLFEIFCIMSLKCLLFHNVPVQSRFPVSNSVNTNTPTAGLHN